MKPRRDTIRQLQSDARIYGHCPNCDADFSMRQASLFYADEPPPGDAMAKREELLQDIRQRTQVLRKKRLQARKGAERITIDVNLGKILERIAPALEGFGYNPRDCRALFDPIDYIAFNGLVRRAAVDSIAFLDVKTGEAGLNTHQRQVRDAIDQRKVEWKEYPLKRSPQ